MAIICRYGVLLLVIGQISFKGYKYRGYRGKGSAGKGLEEVTCFGYLRIHNAGVGGSSPPVATTYFKHFSFIFH